MTLDAFLSHFAAVRPAGGHRWTAQCPAHEDRSHDTLSIAVGAEERRLVYCWAGCELIDVLNAAQLAVGDLFVRTTAAPTTYRQRVDAEIQQLLSERERRFGPYRHLIPQSAAIRENLRSADAVRRVATRRDPEEAFTWELLAEAADWEREALAAEAEQESELRTLRPARPRD